MKEKTIEISEEDSDFGFSLVDNSELVEKAKTVDIADQNILKYKNKLVALKKAIWPFLTKLQENPEKDIHWPNRDVKIKEFKEKLERIIGDTDTDS